MDRGRLDIAWIRVLPSRDLGRPQSRQTSEALPVLRVWVMGLAMAANRLAGAPGFMTHCCILGVLVHGWQSMGWRGWDGGGRSLGSAC